MANQLKVAMQQRIKTLHELGWSNRKIARELGIHRETVARYVQLAGFEDSKPAKVTPGSESLEPSKPAKVTPGSKPTQSLCKPFRNVILHLLNQGLTGQRIWQDLKDEYGFTGSYSSVKRYVRRLKNQTPLPFRRMECDPGMEAQIDFGKGAFVFDAKGRRRRPHVLRLVLSHSRKGYSEAILRQTTENFIRCLENAFWYMGGVPKTLVIDNLRAAVSKADWYDPDLNPKILAFAEHYGTVILPTKSYTPRHKGKIESGVGYVQDNGLKGRTFTSLQEENRFLLDWEESIADTRIHGTTRKQVGKIFEEVEREKLRPLPQDRFPFFFEAERKVHRDGHVEVDKSFYSVPPEYLGHTLLVRWDSRMVRIYTNHRVGPLKRIAVHVKREPGRFSTDQKHIASEKICYVERGAGWLLRKIRLIGPQAGAWAEAMLKERGIPGVRVLAGLLSLSSKNAATAIDQACGTALSHGAFRLRVIQELLKRQLPPQAKFEFMEHHPIIREMCEYGEFLEVKFGATGTEINSSWPLLPTVEEQEKDQDSVDIGRKSS
jgi:transposase